MHERFKSVVLKTVKSLCIGFAVLLFLSVWLGPVTPNLRTAQQSAAMQTAHSIELCLVAYAEKHNGHYPEGKTSTEVFQQLIDGKYAEDPKVFYVPMLGKVKPESDQLKQENVCWDVTCCVDLSAPDQLPVVFLTGFKIVYRPGAPATPIDRSQEQSKRTWAQWWNGTESSKIFIAVAYAGNSAMEKRANEDGVIPNFISADFDPKGKTYHQLTP